MTEMIEYVLPIYSISNLYWCYQFTGKISKYGIIGIVIGVINAFLPMEQINRVLFSPEEIFENPKPLNDVEDLFLTVNILSY